MSKRCLPLLAILFGLSSAAFGQVQASFGDGLISIDCRNAPLSSVFEKIEEVAGVELILEDAIKSTRLTANLDAVPVAMAVQRLLEGSGVNYAVMMDPRDWGRVDKVFVGAGGGGPARSAAPTRQPPPQPMEENYDEYESYDEFDNLDDMSEDFVDDPAPELNDGTNPAEMPPPGSSPVPSYLPPQQSFPRSNFTPGLPGQTPPPNNRQQQQQQQQGQTPPPPATMPFMDALGRPIPVPPEMYDQQQQQRRRQQQQQEP